MTEGGFAVVEFETTALGDGGRHIVEIAVVHTDRAGIVTGVWETLINPGQSLTGGELDGIDASAIEQAPTFDRVAPDLIGLLSGRIVIAHQARVDTGRLLTDLRRTAEKLQLPALGIQQVAEETMHGRDERAADRCEGFSVGVVGAHRALVEAIVTARLLAIHLRSSDDAGYWGDLVDSSRELVWPPVSVVDVEWIAREIGDSDPGAFAHRIARGEPDESGPSAHVEYFMLLDASLRTSPLSDERANELVDLARRNGIGREMCEELNRAYFDDLARVARVQGMSPPDMAELVTIGRDLGVPTFLIRGALATVAPTAQRRGDGYLDDTGSGQLPDSGLNPAA